MTAEPLDELRRAAVPLRGLASDFDLLLERAGEARLVLLGEASHGTHEFYRRRAELTRRLIVEKGFHPVAAEADWPDAYRINRCVRGQDQDRTTVDALADFARFPAWMWRNADVLDFVGWLREHNERRPVPVRAGFYGLDLYSLRASMQAVIDYLERTDPGAAARARQRYACFDHFGEDVGQSYGYAAGFGLTASCEQEVLAQLRELRRHAAEFPEAAPLDEDESFFAEQNARVVTAAEEYYRAMFRGRVSSWNLRDQHMMATLEALLARPVRCRHSRRSHPGPRAARGHRGLAAGRGARDLPGRRLSQRSDKAPRPTDDCACTFSIRDTISSSRTTS
jgi:erythromycin esterase-like protein